MCRTCGSPDHDDELHPDLMRLGAAALQAAINNDWAAASTALERITARHPGNIWAVVCAWVDTMGNYAGVDEALEAGIPLSLGFVDGLTGEELDTDEVPAAERWAGRLITARLAGDRDTWEALIDVLPDGVAARRIFMVLQTCADAIAGSGCPRGATGN